MVLLNIKDVDRKSCKTAFLGSHRVGPGIRAPTSSLSVDSALQADGFSMVIHCKYEKRMVKKLTKHGNSLALVIDRPILDLLKIDPETPLDVSTDGKQLIVAPAKPSVRRKKFEAAQELAHKRYGKAFRKLAE